MSYLHSHCTYQEFYNEQGEHCYKFTGPCMITGEDYSVTVKGPDLFAYNKGKHIQDAFPYLSSNDREFLMSGFSPEGWKKIFGPEGEVDEDGS